MAKNLVIVESPTKAKTISKFLSKDYNVQSSFGHVRDLPKTDLGVDVEHDFEPKYVIPTKAKKNVSKLKELAEKATNIILATDEDREGEAIAWHLIQALKIEKKPKQRIVFHEITKKAIEDALKNPRDIDINLVDAQQARRVLDRLVGYKLSPLLWKKVARGLSAGRVQSVAVRLVVEREREIKDFKAEEYWSIAAELKSKNDPQTFPAKLIKEKDKSLDKLAIKDEAQAQKIVDNLNNADYQIIKIEKKETNKSPFGPFTTSTLQQEASKKFGYSAKQTMMLAQQLYEGIELGSRGSVGLITYMRTDSLNLSKEAVGLIRDYIESQIGKNYLPAAPIIYKTKSKGAQEAHEAIRTTDINNLPDEIAEFLNPKQLKLYKLIWQRTLACQMANAIMDSTAVDIKASDYLFRANGSTIKFDGFLKIYPLKTEENILPALKENEILELLKLNKEQHFTEPPARYTEASLIKTLEEHGIGRPSTYAPTLSTIQERNYIIKNEQKRFEPTEIGTVVNDLLVEHFPAIVDYAFTAGMEESLDEIAEGKKKWVPIIKEFYIPFAETLKIKEKEIVKEVEETSEICEKCGSPMVIKRGRFGKFMACSNYPKCKNTKQLESEENPMDQSPETSTEVCEKCGSPMVLKHGRFGKFLACSKYPECKSTKAITKSTGVTCPECGQGEIVERKSKRGRSFYSCNRYPDCKFALWNKPTGEKCPKCSSLLVYSGKDKISCSNKECDYKSNPKQLNDTKD